MDACEKKYRELYTMWQEIDEVRNSASRTLRLANDMASHIWSLLTAVAEKLPEDVKKKISEEQHGARVN